MFPSGLPGYANQHIKRQPPPRHIERKTKRFPQRHQRRVPVCTQCKGGATLEKALHLAIVTQLYPDLMKGCRAIEIHGHRGTDFFASHLLFHFILSKLLSKGDA